MTTAKQVMLLVVTAIFVAGCWKTPVSDKLVKAARNDNLAELTRLTAQQGVSLDAKEIGMLGETPLIASTLVNGTNVFFYLLSAGAKVDARDREGKTALMSAVMVGDANLTKIKALIAAGANVNARDKFGSSVLTYAKWASAGHVATNTLDLLQQNGAKE